MSEKAQPLQTTVNIVLSRPFGSMFSALLSLQEDLLSFTYDDKENNEVDEISITLKDEKGKWASYWKPEGGEKVNAIIYTGSIYTPIKKKLDCGTFYVDSLRVSGSPRTMEIKAVSVPLNKPIRRKIKTRAWEKVTLKDIAQKIAEEAGLTPILKFTDNPTYDRHEQKRESDLKFLSRLCEEIGLSLKIAQDSLIVFDQGYYEKLPAIKTFTLGKSDILSWDFETSQSEVYKSVEVQYRDPKKNKKVWGDGYNFDLERVYESKEKNVYSYVLTDPTVSEDGQEYGVKTRAKSLNDAKRIAKANLRRLNLRRLTGSMTIIGDVSLHAGDVIKCVGFGSFDGNFVISTASHNVSSSGYTTTLSLRRANTEY